MLSNTKTASPTLTQSCVEQGKFSTGGWAKGNLYHLCTCPPGWTNRQDGQHGYNTGKCSLLLKPGCWRASYLFVGRKSQQFHGALPGEPAADDNERDMPLPFD
eukprot:3627318-Amphidinium_carterae.4